LGTTRLTLTESRKTGPGGMPRLSRITPETLLKRRSPVELLSFFVIDEPEPTDVIFTPPE
jgi:hypothetical protein